MWAAFGACARRDGFAAAAACGEAFGSKRVAARAWTVLRRLSVHACSARARRKAAVTTPWRVDGARSRASMRQPERVLQREHLDISGTRARYATSFRTTLLRLTRGTNPYRLDAAARNLFAQRCTDVIQQLEKQRRHQVTGFVLVAVERLLEAPQYWRWRAGAGRRGQRAGCRQAEAEQSKTARGGECNKEIVVVR